jgi:EAL domain-containing protein (putative c-di-GMP-specific phosphodiesterase class I)
MRTWLLQMIEDGAFRPVFQPIVDLQRGGVVGYEALTRFDDGQSPDTVFAIARQVGLLDTLEEATAFAALRGAAALPAGWVSVNLSASTLVSSPAVRAALRAAPRPVVVELTEHEPVDDYDVLRLVLADLRPDVLVAIDDVGAGFACMRHLLDLRPDLVKLDRGLIEGLAGDRTRQALVAGLAGVVRTMGGSLVAEGVERDDQVACLRQLGVDLGQGWAFAPPQTATTLAA